MLGSNDCRSENEGVGLIPLWNNFSRGIGQALLLKDVGRRNWAANLVFLPSPLFFKKIIVVNSPPLYLNDVLDKSEGNSAGHT